MFDDIIKDFSTIFFSTLEHAYTQPHDMQYEYYF